MANGGKREQTGANRIENTFKFQLNSIRLTETCVCALEYFFLDMGEKKVGTMKSAGEHLRSIPSSNHPVDHSKERNSRMLDNLQVSDK